MGIVVQKYGGSSLADLEKLKRVASRVVATAAQGHKVVVAVSAMGRTTDDLLALAKGVHPSPNRRELDMLLTVGERISMALLSLAIQALGREAISFTGSQSGIITDDRHSDARIIEVRPARIEAALDRGIIVIVAGYQGMSRSREVTTLGRGGTDTTAVALAAALKADYCEICSDVDGVYTADPRVVAAPERLGEVSYAEMQELAESGAKVLCSQAVEWAKRAGITIYARSTAQPPLASLPTTPFPSPSSDDLGTVVHAAAPGTNRVVGIASEKGLVLVTAARADIKLVCQVTTRLNEKGAATKQVVLMDGSLSLLLPLQNVHNYGEVRQALLSETQGRIGLREGVGAVSVVGEGVGRRSDFIALVETVLREAGVEAIGLHTSSFRITALVADAAVDTVVRALHARFVEDARGLRQV